jgi:hypothetical protein
MQSVVCTLFEGEYHYGVAALTNSLYRRGFRGSIYAGYRGKLSSWCLNSTENTLFDWPNSTSLEVIEGIIIHFLPLDTGYHMANYKPDFMLSLLNGPASGTQEIYYIDCDIVVTAPWAFFKDWTDCGIALCEDTNSPLAKFHPRRVGWRNHYEKDNIILNFKNDIYVNGGFIGINSKHFDFINQWRTLQELMGPLIGGLDRSSLKGSIPKPAVLQNKFFAFEKTDQDALNATVEAWNGPISYIGKEGMGFKPGNLMLPHAIGRAKPWKTKYFRKSIFGVTPRVVDKVYWKSVSYPIKVYPDRYIAWKKTELALAAFIGRFYSRS